MLAIDLAWKTVPVTGATGECGCAIANTRVPCSGSHVFDFGCQRRGHPTCLFASMLNWKL